MEIDYFHKDIKEFLKNLDSATRAKAYLLIEALGIEEYKLSMPYSKKIDRNLYELRTQSIQNIRIFYTFFRNTIVLLHCIHKKTQKLEKRDLETAKRRLSNLH